MLNFFDAVAAFFESIWQMIVNLVTGLINALVMVVASISVPIQLLPLVPSFIGASVSIVFGIGITKLIIGWGNS